MQPFRNFRLFLLFALIACLPLAAVTVDTQSVSITYNGSSGATTATVHVSNASNISARIGKNLDSSGALVSSGGNTPGIFVQNVSEDTASTAAINIGTDSNSLGALARRGTGSYPGATLLISATGCTDCITVALTLNITSGGTIAISYNGSTVTSSGITLYTTQGGSTSAQITLSSTNPTAFQISSNQTWLTVNPAAGNFTGSQAVTLTVNAFGLPIGTNQATLSVSAGGVTTSFPVTVNNGTGGGLTLSPNVLNFQYVTSNSSFPTGQTQYVTLSGASSTATYSATASSNPAWLLVGASSGTTVSGLSVLSQLPVSVNPAILNLTVAATYTGTISITTSDGFSGSVTVNLQITSTNNGGTGALNFSVVAPGGAAPPTQQISLTGSGTYNAFAGTTTCGQGWISVSPATGTLSSIPTNLTVQVFPGNIGTGTCSATISISTTGLFSNGTNFQTISVTMTIGGTTGTGGTVASPSALTFSIPSGVTQSQTIVVNGDGSSFTAQAIGTNLSVFPINGTTPAVLTVTANSSSSSGTIIVSSSLGTQNVGVTVNVLSGNVITANPASVALIYTPGQSLPTQSISINASQDAAGSNLTYSVSSAPSFISYATTASTTPSSIGVGVNPSQLGPGFNSGNIVITTNNASNNSLTIPVTVLAPGSTPSFVSSSNPVNLTGTAFGGPVSQQVSISGLSGTSFNATATSSSNWLSVTPSSGTSPTTLTITGNPGTLSASAAPYTGTVNVSASNGTTLSILVNFTVSSTGPTTPALSVGPGSLTFNYRKGDSAPSPQNVTVSTTNGFTSYTATSNVSWITISQQAGNTPATLAISINTAQVNAGTQTGTITITASGATNSPQTVMVTANVTLPPSLTLDTTSAMFSYRTGDPNPPSQTIQVGSGGSAVPFTVSVTNAPWLSVTPTSGTTPATLTLAVDPTKVQVGSYSATITISGTGVTSQTIMVSFTVSAPLPTVTDVRNYASMQAGPIAAGEMIAIDGTSLGQDPATQYTLNGDLYPTIVANTRVRVSGYLAPIVSASSTQVIAIVPYGIAGKTSSYVEVEYLGQRSNDWTVQVANAAPGVFTADGSGQGQAKVTNADGTPNSPDNPAPIGTVITVTATGEGQTNPAGTDGKLADGDVIPQPVLPVTASISGVPAAVQTAGGIPNQVAGMLQVQILVPSGATTGDLVLHIGGNDSQSGATVYIAQPAQ